MKADCREAPQVFGIFGLFALGRSPVKSHQSVGNRCCPTFVEKVFTGGLYHLVVLAATEGSLVNSTEEHI